MRRNFYPVLQALLAALLFGISAPLAKLLLGEVQPVPLAALLYLGSGTGAFLMLLLQHTLNGGKTIEAHLSRSDLPWLAGAMLAGGVAAGEPQPGHVDRKRACFRATSHLSPAICRVDRE